MIDLHLHFDGSLLPRTVLELADEQGIELPAREPDELKLFLTAPADCESLNEYLEKFDLPLLVLQTKEAIRKGMYTPVSYTHLEYGNTDHCARDLFHALCGDYCAGQAGRLR